jgi:annexin A7/11
VYNKSLDKDIEDEQNGPLGRIFRSIVSGGRPDNSSVDYGLAEKEAQELYDAGQGRLGTDEGEFVRILCSRSFAQLRATFEEYYKISNTDIEQAIKKEMSGDLARACLAIARSVKNKPAYFAKQLNKAMKGMGTKDEDLIRLLVIRSEYDLEDIKREYASLYGKSLYDDVKGELSGDYEKLFKSLIGK